MGSQQLKLLANNFQMHSPNIVSQILSIIVKTRTEPNQNNEQHYLSPLSSIRYQDRKPFSRLTENISTLNTDDKSTKFISHLQLYLVSVCRNLNPFLTQHRALQAYSMCPVNCMMARKVAKS